MPIVFVYGGRSVGDRSLNCTGDTRGRKFEFAMIADGHVFEFYAIGMADPKRTRMEPDVKGSIEISVDFAADEGADTYRCRLASRGTLACLNTRPGPGDGVELKKMSVDEDRIYMARPTP